ncbi:ras-related protein Rab-44 isoform X1 [Piliocolobus tephrosceles]|uniref:RAB44, member RAS onco family n=1 Tax=Piliocolobus tephrosceles TaxID=591936 RepID=A0A8C9IIZ3_9PRIM|nr:ras-related protein Rab-44 isoform X1 [Piliocolobus tephrosceles]XP_023068432.2 ras-related protein Rab-44 isoform X2 [Piliocolobus tephrosceles]XP_023068433.2 ras-related protein Rab-44 isoform X1 [Piliocolobus tephrosceles]XP_023068434.2 ras-related protein Rab-44 isoform X1 [Piliocolobus tephrosceles]XP_023068435.2 ras-related protein Rab-44 isoform X1 [Piliocolobus tephrosceles]
METGQRTSRKVRKLGSSRRRQTREPADGEDAEVAPEPESWSSQAAAELQAFFQDCGAKERGFVTREDLAVAKFSFLGSKEESEMIFDWVDVERKGHLSLEEFSSGLKNIFGSSQSSHRLRRRKPLPSKRVSATTSFPALEEADAEEKEAFLAFIEQLGTGHLLPKQTEIWQLWGQLRQEEPQLAGNLAGFLAKMTSRLQEAQADKEALELTLRKCDSDHHREVQQLYEEMEQQIRQEKQQLQAESDSRGLALTSQMQDVLEAKEREVQRLAEGQRELEAQLSHLRSTHQEAASENQQLQEAKRDLAGRLEEVQGQLQVTRERLDAARGRVSWQVEEKRSVPGVGEKTPDPQAVSPEEAPLPGLFGDNDDWDQLLSNFGSPPHGALQLCWSPPPTPRAASGPQTPRVVRQISISEPQALLFGQEPSSDPDGAPRTPPGVPFSAKDSKGVDPDEQDISAEQPVEPHDLDPNQEPGSTPKGRLLWGLSGSLVAPAFKVLIPLEDGPPPPPQAPAGSSKQIQASDPDDKDPGSWAPPRGAQPGAGPGPQEPTQTPPTMTEPETQPGPSPTTAFTGVGPAKPPRQRDTLQQNLHATGSEPRPGAQRARALTLGPTEPFQGLEFVGPLPTERLEQGHAGPVVQEGLPEGLREAHGRVLGLGELSALPQQGLEEEPRSEEGKQEGRGEQDLSSEQSVEAHGLETAHSLLPQQDSLLVSPPSATPQAQAEAEDPAPGKPAPPRGSPPGRAQPGAGAGPKEPTRTPPTMAEQEAQPRPSLMTAHAEEQGPPHSGEPRAESRLEDPGTDSREAGLTPSGGDPMARGGPQVNPDYLFHVIFLGDSNVGKTSFLHLLHQNSFATGLTATVGVDFRVKTLLVDNKCFVLQLWDTAGQERYHSMTRQLLRKADGVVLMYDITSQESFGHVRYWLDCLQDAGSDGVVILLLGNKMDCEEERQVSTEAGQQLARELGVSFGECSAALGRNILEPVVNLARSLRMQEEGLKGSLVEVTPKRQPKKFGCCS